MLCKVLLLLALVSHHVLAQAPPAAADASDPGARKAKALIQQMIQALGGDAYLNYHEREERGRVYSISHGQSGGGAPFWRYWVWPDKERYEFWRQHNWVIVYNGDSAMETTYQRTRPLPRADVAAYRQRRDYSLENVLRRWLNEPGLAYFYEGRGLAGAKSADRVTLMTADNRAVTIFIDPDTRLPMKKSYTLRDPDTRERNEEEETFDNYKLVDGIQTPFSVVRWHNGEMTNQRFIFEVRYNRSVSDSIFASSQAPSPGW
jgi:hypothetical protein